MMKNPLNGIYSYPPNIISRVIELGLMEEKKPPNRMEVIRKKWPAIVVFGVLLGLFVYFVNNADSFIKGFGVSYGIWLIVDWYDAIVLDMIWFCHAKKVRIPGTEDIPFVQTWKQVLKKRIFLTLVWTVGAALVAGIVVVIF